jgi:hypothetical protein
LRTTISIALHARFRIDLPEGGGELVRRGEALRDGFAADPAALPSLLRRLIK